MAFTDLSPEELVRYRPDIPQPADFDDFWSSTIAEARSLGGDPELSPADTPVSELVVEDIVFPGFGGEPIRGWLTRPRGDEPRPVVVEYRGYGGGRGLPHENLAWAASGYVHLLMDSRGQASNWGTGGATPDPHGSGPATPGVMTKGIEHPETYYYRRLFTDAVRAVDAARSLPFVDATRTAVTGGSQGGAISLAVAGLVPDLSAVMPDVPFLCDFRRSVQRTPRAPFTEVTTYLSVHRDRVEQVFETLSYFDGVNFARRASAPARFSVGLMDDIVLPSTVYAAFNHYAGGEKTLDVYEFNGHEGGQGHQWQRQAGWLRDRLG
ncbi:acetylxylan esterase [Schumannella luteola]